MERAKFIIKNGLRKFFSGIAHALAFFILCIFPGIFAYWTIQKYYAWWIALLGAIVCLALWWYLIYCFYDAYEEWKRLEIQKGEE